MTRERLGRPERLASAADDRLDIPGLTGADIFKRIEAILPGRTTFLPKLPTDAPCRKLKIIRSLHYY